MAAIIEQNRRHNRKPALKTAVLTVNGAGKRFPKNEAEKSGDLFVSLVCGFTIVVLMIAFLNSY